MIPLAGISEHLEGSVDVVQARLAAAPDDEVGALGNELAVYYRSAAIAGLLVDYDPNRFVHMLTRSGMMRAYVLRRLARGGEPAARYVKLSNSRSLFDALAVGRFDIADTLLALSPREWTSKYEYEDDFAYVRTLGLLATETPAEDVTAALARYEAALVGDAGPRFEVARSMAERDEDGFAEAFDALLDVRDTEVAAEEISLSRNDFDFAASRHVFIEGLAILRLADRLGLPTEAEYRYCPKEAGEPATVPFPDDRYPR